MSDGFFGFGLFLIFTGLIIYLVKNEIKKVKEESYSEQKRKMNEALHGGVKNELAKSKDGYNKSRNALDVNIGDNAEVLRRHGIIGDDSKNP